MMRSEQIVNATAHGGQIDGNFGFLTLRNRSRLPGKLPFQTMERKRIVPRLRNRLLAWVLRKQLYENDEEEYKISVWNYIEWLFVSIVTAGLVLTVSIRSLREKQILENYLWTYELSLLMVVASRLACAAAVRVIVCFLHMLFRSHNEFLYVVYKIRHSVKWSMMAWVVVAAWEIVLGRLAVLLDNQVMKVIDKIMITCGIILSIWLMKSILVMSLAAWFHMRTYREKIAESLFYRYVLEALSSPPLVQLSSYLPPDADIGLGELRKLNPKELSSWEMKRMMIKKEKCLATKIKTEVEARSEAEKIFQNVAKPLSQFIDLEDLRRFLPDGEALNMFRRTYEEDENIKISLIILQEWMVYYFKRHRCLLLSLKDTDAASKTIGTMFSIVFGILLAAFSIPLLGLGGVKYLAVFGLRHHVSVWAGLEGVVLCNASVVR